MQSGAERGTRKHTVSTSSTTNPDKLQQSVTLPTVKTPLQKSHQVRVYLPPDKAKQLQELEAASGLSQSQLVSLFVSATLEAVSQHGGKITIPLVMVMG